MQESGAIDYENQLITTAFDRALRYGVRAAPTLVYLQEGRPVRVSPGFQSKEAITAVLNMIQNG
jgi:thioredoxin-like negative regulator of GroEL